MKHHFEKMGAMMAENDGQLLGIYDELTTFLTQINLFKGKGISDSHDLALFLQLYNGFGWSRKTGKVIYTVTYQHYKWSVAPYVTSLHQHLTCYTYC